MFEGVGNPIDLFWLRAGAAFVISLLALTACISGDSSSERDPDLPPSATASIPTVDGGTGTFTPADPSATPFIRPTSVVRPTPPPVPPVPDAVTAAVARIAADLELNLSEVELLGYEEARWPSTALGCPAQERSYAQIVTSGYRLQLSILGELAVYHVDESAVTIVECEGETFEP